MLEHIRPLLILPRVAVLLCVVAATIAVVARYPQAVADMGRVARDNAALSYSDREIAGGNSVLPAQGVMYEARARIAEDESYEVLVGEPVESWPELTRDHATGFARYFLLPRRQAEGAGWVLCFNCGFDADDGEVVWQGEDEVSIIRRPQ